MAGDFREFFDIRKLDDQQIAEIAFILMSPAYEHSFKPYIQGILNSMNRMWLDRSVERKDHYPDEFLAGGATYGEGLLKFFEQVLSEVSIDRLHESMAHMTSEEQYDMRREAGQVKPVVGLDQPALPEMPGPEEDY